MQEYNNSERMEEKQQFSVPLPGGEFKSKLIFGALFPLLVKKSSL